ncbi:MULTISPECIES: hypothetical protein [Alteromonadales]|uniref:Uncharacterized protein n=1 Tax=Psychromonas aquatilis TaxID=2005072 RepID=A0ABU9GUA2_9GAMM|nr:hypothetical protein [Pseudoalteromonas sp. SA25]
MSEKISIIYKTSIIFLLLTSIIMLYKGITVANLTSGTVYGGEFSMLITLSNQFSYFMVWLASLAFYLVANNIYKASFCIEDNS